MSEKKIVEAEGKIEVLLRRVEKVVKVKGLVSVVGLIVSFGLAEGRSARFYMRFIKGSARGKGHLGGGGLASEHDGEGDQVLRGAQAGAQMDAGLRVPSVVQDTYFPGAVGL